MKYPRLRRGIFIPEMKVSANKPKAPDLRAGRREKDGKRYEDQKNADSCAGLPGAGPGGCGSGAARAAHRPVSDAGGLLLRQELGPAGPLVPGDEALPG